MSPHDSWSPRQLDGGPSTEGIPWVLSSFDVQSLQLVRRGPAAPGAGPVPCRSISIRVCTHLHLFLLLRLVPATAGLSFWVSSGLLFLPEEGRRFPSLFMMLHATRLHGDLSVLCCPLLMRDTSVLLENPGRWWNIESRINFSSPAFAAV